MMRCSILVAFAAILPVARLVSLEDGGRMWDSPEEDTLTDIGNSLLNQEGNGNRQRNWTTGAECDRECVTGSPRTCYFRFVVERYSVLSPACRNCINGTKEDCMRPQCIPADGVMKPINVVNRALPGTPIIVCAGDTVVVDVENMMADLSTTIHWHGIRQRGTPFMDGVPMVSQCPILPFTNFRYKFKVDQPGTFFWHSHMGPQKLDGLEGALVVRQPKANEINGHLYDYDLSSHVTVVQDWKHTPGVYYTPGLHSPEYIQVPDALLINGLGPLSVVGNQSFVPMSVFTVEAGKAYRFRLIGATCLACPYIFRIQGHNLTLISTDGGLNVKPTVVNTIGLNSADRFDFVLNATQLPGTYYMFVEALQEICGGVRQVAILQYAGVNSGSPELPLPPVGEQLGVTMNNPGAPCDGTRPDMICVSQLKGDSNAPGVSGSNTPYRQMRVAFAGYPYTVDELFTPGTYQHYEEPQYGILQRFMVNNITFDFPPSPLQTQFSDIPDDSFCSSDCNSPNRTIPCSCTNYYPLQLYSIVDVLVSDAENREDMFNHPFHLHGTDFYVLKQGIFRSNITSERDRELTEIGAALRRDDVQLRSRPMKDTITIPAGGYSIIRFRANNPGWWIFHCHFVFHLESGMAAVFRIGEERQMPPTPRNFPRCGSYYPEY